MEDDGSGNGAADTNTEAQGGTLEKWQAKVKAATALLLLLQLVSLMLGCGMVFLYFIRHGFYPGAMSVSDTFTFLFLVFGFAVVWVVSIAYATIAGLPIARTATYCSAKFVPPTRFAWKKGGTPIVIAGVICLFAFVLMILGSRSSEKQIFLLTLLCYGVFASILAFGKISAPPVGSTSFGRPLSALDRWFAQRSNTTRAFAVIILTASGMLGIFFPFIQDLAMISSGFRKQDASVELDKADFVRIAERAAVLGLAVNPCKAIEKEAYVLEHADLLWYQTGTRSLLRFPSMPVGISAPIGTLSFQYESSRPIANILPPVPELRCEEVPSDMLFSPGASTMKKDASKVLSARLSWLEELDPGRRIRVTAHSSAGALGVTLTQAKQIGQWLAKNLTVRPVAIEVAGRDASLPKQACAGQNGRALDRCEAVNRRVEIAVIELE